MNQKQRKDELLAEEEEHDVPMDVWIEILLRLPFISRLSVRFVCRTWNDIITRSHHHPNLTRAALLHHSNSIWFLRPGPFPSVKSLHSEALLALVDLPSGGEPSAPFKYVRHPCTLHDCSLYHKQNINHNDNLLIPRASCHGLVCFTAYVWPGTIFVGNPLLNQELLAVPGFNAATGEVTHWLPKYVVGFGYSPKTNCYKIIQCVVLHLKSVNPGCSAMECVVTCDRYHLKPRCHGKGLIRERLEICTICNGSGEKEESPSRSWRRLTRFPRQISRKTLGSYWKGGIHWLFCDTTDDSIFISRLDLDTEKFGRVQAPQAPYFKTGGRLNLMGMFLGVSDGYLNICANLFSEKFDIWVMKEYNSWTKPFVVKHPMTFPHLWVCENPHVEVLNYAAVEAATRGGAVSEVMLMFQKYELFACTTNGGRVRQLELPIGPVGLIVHNPSFLSIKDAAKR